MDETLQMIGPQGGPSIIESTKQNSAHMKAKGGSGIGMIMLQAHGFCDIVKVTLPTPAATKAAQEADNWGENWVEGFRLATSL
ncbi:hypothetical protein C0995_010366 [Termitomyces sp. Mi166|nr:hypothetical protein C0995_010366 [Termitomyces sp. Mi166\